ncbi:MAG: hypothetical protein OQJ96_05905 [Flavobacteriales bacterium]|nr:hypothetical protein [Flavobacteriales bacterium]MCW8937611.1 hypothetical protein [Flavobacteriales bacterium]MCW8968975.1 hypothetical protein [Flavobacteriales bacterium]MCW8990099.1 hypothetical protein [Flavobacteriales bacterium]MCW9019817.1 hypothetical protein [Flavobacteriales bacterium]
MKKNIYIIIGHGACGKSSLVRALTGIYSGGAIRFIRSVNGTDTKFAIWVRSRQEVGDKPAKVLEDVKNNKETNVLLTLRFGEYNRCPEAKEYVDLLMTEHNVSHIVYMGSDKEPATLTYSTIKSIVIGNSVDTPVNANASVARKLFGWL